MSRPLRALIEVRPCRCCSAVQVICPRCGTGWEVGWPEPLSRFPAQLLDACDGPEGCGMELHLRAIGWALPVPQPSPEAPGAWASQSATPADLSDRQRLERLWQEPPAPRPARPLPAPTAGSTTTPAKAQPPPPPARPLPCPAGAERHRLADWSRRGWLPEGVAPSSVAAAYRRCFGAEPPRDPEHHAKRAYSLRELGLALGELGLAPNPEPLRVIWDQTLQRVALPSTRLLLQQQAHLSELNDSDAVVTVGLQWWALVESRAALLSAALSEVVGRPVHVWTAGVAQ